MCSQANILFDQALQDKRLIEADNLTYSQLYFWANQTLCVVNKDIKALISAYESNFIEDMWEGHHASIWPRSKCLSARYSHWRTKMAVLRRQFAHEITKLKEAKRLNFLLQKQINSLRSQLFYGTINNMAESFGNISIFRVRVPGTLFAVSMLIRTAM
jgi:hypothetical protein